MEPFLSGRVAAAAGYVLAFELLSTDSIAGTDLSDVWVVAGAGTVAQVTSHPDGTYAKAPMLSPDGQLVAFTRTTATETERLYVVNVDGTGEAVVYNFNLCLTPQWFPSSTKLAFLRGQVVRSIDVDGSNETIIVNKATVTDFAVNTDGTLIAYILRTASGGLHDELWVIGTDGTGDTRIVSSLGLVGGYGGPVWRRDSDVIVFPSSSAGVQSINADGTGLATLVSPLPSGFWAFQSMGPDSDRIFYTDTSTFTDWRVAQVMLDGSGQSFVSPTLHAYRAVQRGVPMGTASRVFTVRDTTDDLVSILPDGSDLTVDYVPTETADLFESIFLRA